MSELENPSPKNLANAMEALLFVSAEPVTVFQLATALDISSSQIEKNLDLLESKLRESGLRLQRNGGRVQLTTAPEFAEDIERFLGFI